MVACVRLLPAVIASAGFGCGGHDTAGQHPTGGAGGTIVSTGGTSAGGSIGVAGGGGGLAGADGGQPTGSGGVQVGAGGGSAGATGASGTGGSADLTGGVEWEPWPDVEAAPASTCAVSKFIGGDRSSSPSSVWKETWEYDSAMRVLTRRHAASGTTAAWVGYARFDSQGRREMICHAQSDFVCEDWVRDSLGNAKSYSYFAVVDGPLDARTLDPAHPPTKAPIAGGESETERLTYDDAGRLSTATYFFPGQGASLTFSPDAQGRCGDVVWGIREPSLVEVDHWTYVGDKLASRVVTNMNDASDVRAVMTYAYDSEGNLAATVVDGRLDMPDVSSHPARRDGIADYVVRSVKQPDGSRWVEILDFELDTNNAHVMRNGTLTPAFRYRWYSSPACEALSLPKHTSQDCEFERPTPMMPLGWHNPLLTPIQLWTASPLAD